MSKLRKGYSRFFGIFYDKFMYSLEQKYLMQRRKKLLSGLKGKILEVGVGTGINLQFYSQNDIEITGIEPSPHMLSQAVKKRDLLLLPDRINLHEIGCGYPEMQNLIQPASLDVVVCTLVLCTIPDIQLALDRFVEWLKPGGKLIILEHIRSHNSLKAKIQDVINPLWEKLADGCQLNRPTDKILASSGLLKSNEEYFKIAIPFYQAEYTKPFN